MVADNLTGGAGDDLINGGSGRDRIFGQNGNDTLNGDGSSDYLEGGTGSDLIDGGDGNDTITGIEVQIPDVPPIAGGIPNFDLIIGAGEIDTLTGGSGADRFILGDPTNGVVYYDDKDNFTAGESDFAVITDFDATQDEIFLYNSPEFYSLDFFTSDTGSINAKLIYDTGIEMAAEQIAVIENISPDLTLDDSAFVFIIGAI